VGPRARPLVRVVSPALSLCPPSSWPVGVPTVPTVSWGSWLSAWGLGSAVRPAAPSGGKRSAMRECPSCGAGSLGVWIRMLTSVSA
jgi:hypothetical protein